jgi:hypothetical protein
LIRFVRMFALVAVLAGIFAATASALAFDDRDFNVTADGIWHFPEAGEVGTAYKKVIHARAGCTPYKYSVLAGALPPGISLSSDGIVSGTPTVMGSWRFWLRLAGIGCANEFAEREFQLDVNSIRVQVTTSQLPAASVGKPYNAALAGQGTGQLAWSIADGSLPAGLTLASNGTISGTPAAVGDSSVTVKLTDVANPARTDTKILALSVVEPLKLTAGPARPVAEVGRPFSTTVKATGGKAPYTWEQGELPAGFSFDPATGVLSGQPETPGTVPITLTLKDALGTSAAFTLNIKVAAHLEIATKKLKAGSVGRAYIAKIAVTGGVRAFKWQARGKLPAGLRLDPRSGAIVGTPRTAGTFRLTVRVRDALHAVSTKTIVLSVR